MRWPAIALGGFVVALVAVIVAPTVIDFSKTDPDRHGRTAVPGDVVVELPAGDVGVYYGERRRLPSTRRGNTVVSQTLPVPALEIRVSEVGGGREARLRTAFASGTQISGARRTTRQFGVLEVPAGGDYRVSVRSREPLRFPDPVLSLGTDSTDETEFAPSEWLLDHLQAVILGAVVLVLGGAILVSRRRTGPPPGAGPTVRL